MISVKGRWTICLLHRLYILTSSENLVLASANGSPAMLGESVLKYTAKD